MNGITMKIDFSTCIVGGWKISHIKSLLILSLPKSADATDSNCYIFAHRDETFLIYSWNIPKKNYDNWWKTHSHTLIKYFPHHHHHHIFFKPFRETTELQHLCKNNFLLRLIVVPFLLLCFVMFIVCAILIFWIRWWCLLFGGM